MHEKSPFSKGFFYFCIQIRYKGAVKRAIESIDEIIN